MLFLKPTFLVSLSEAKTENKLVLTVAALATELNWRLFCVIQRVIDYTDVSLIH